MKQRLIAGEELSLPPVLKKLLQNSFMIAVARQRHVFMLLIKGRAIF